MRVSINSRSLFAALALSTIAFAPLHARPVVAAETTLVAKADLPASSARWVGVYRITLAERKDGAMVDARVLIEPNGQNLMGMLMVDQHASGITDVKIENEALVARVVTAEGKGTLTLRTTDEGVVGDLKIGKRTWAVSGARAI
ncbi:hypothetical protein [Roseisolibacter agri]|uniref:Uncharacterized protein n=1 Tax=Roseisolibacter agri TaxID=2014610 RepID=A0AA37Q527_9BACT|nr:hypothetical protein [Roseisolibacter agri]GLC26734.1 hypothetical protein rosag_32470 [Roseisolibacter agri]